MISPAEGIGIVRKVQNFECRLRKVEWLDEYEGEGETRQLSGEF